MNDHDENDPLDDFPPILLPEPGSVRQHDDRTGEDQFPGEPVRRRRVPAKIMVAATLLALVLTVLLDAQGLLRTAQRQQLGWERSLAVPVMKPIAHFSHDWYLDRPRDWVLRASGHEQPSTFTSTRGIKLASATPRPSTLAADGSTAPTSTTTTLPSYRIPTAAAPLKVLVAGDSLSDGIATSLSNALGGMPANVELDRHVGTGLARPDVVDWPLELTGRMDSDKPDVVVLIFGGNDAQALRMPDGWIRPDDTQAWHDEYERRVAQIMNIVARPGVSVYWIGMPVTNVASIQAKVPVMDEAVRVEAAARSPQVTYVDPGPALDGPGGSYTAYLPGPDGRNEQVRHDDGVHMTIAGTNRVVALFAQQLATTRHLAAPPPGPH
ncbi:MAG: DUF459 domain-containing protein [Actinobacteria bacterium]|nr:DUF459 domain-containing protein [Actinomycetota bacterium]